MSDPILPYKLIACQARPDGPWDVLWPASPEQEDEMVQWAKDAGFYEVRVMSAKMDACYGPEDTQPLHIPEPVDGVAP